MDGKGFAGVLLTVVWMLAYGGLIYGFSSLDAHFWPEGEKKSPVRAILCAAAGIPTVAVCVRDILRHAYASGWSALVYLLLVHVLFALGLFAIGYPMDRE